MSGCQRCGECCTAVCTTITPEDFDWLAFHGGHVVIEQGRLMGRFDVACQKYDPLTSRCSIYDERPLTCRLYLCDKTRT